MPYSVFFSRIKSQYPWEGWDKLRGVFDSLFDAVQFGQKAVAYPESALPFPCRTASKVCEYVFYTRHGVEWRAAAPRRLGSDGQSQNRLPRRGEPGVPARQLP